ncbi:hypothetical protein SAMN02745146_0262 [Hymenobacter daecheongensis DSM 21074]|uniref:Lipoprotein n=1 Tax=Hymenobacter daecheongensis DSM 21074 TaxID=1121955 RepID=A0A1M6MFJ8_9BACT|nr:hypothetical protein [Hymenobacter daecheongensis]SHJ82100.1 hypothetical protein SAMN02745146_0262 [Hymenobacter daecheongensis DSM 21074]
MKLSQRVLLAGALAASATFAACDRSRTPGTDQQTNNDFSDAPPARKMETDMDSVNTAQNVNPPAGTGSAADQQQATDQGTATPPAGLNESTPVKGAAGGPPPPGAASYNNTKSGTNSGTTQK